MTMRDELVKKLIENGKWEENWEVYKEELLGLLLEDSGHFLTIEDFPPLSTDDVRELNSFAKSFKGKYKAVRRPRSL